ncbi:predicted protein [Mycobacterium tuberculosis GM 1503]|nr:predicted protein [Mycobacterium tuberculosis GM 1503]
MHAMAIIFATGVRFSMMGTNPLRTAARKSIRALSKSSGMLPGSTCRTPTCGTLAPGIAANELADPPNGEHASTGESVLEELGSVGAAEPIAWVVTAAPTPRTTANAPTWPMRLA